MAILHVSAASPQEPASPQSVSREQLQAAVDNLGKVDYDTRTNAARTIRRIPATQAVPALLQAVREHADGYVRYRALVLLTGFNDPRTVEAMREALSSPNDRLRTVAYSYFEQHPDKSMAAEFIAALEKEQGEFVRPALVRALAALGNGDPKVQQVLLRDVNRGEDFFRSAVIEALGDYKAAYAFNALTDVAKLDGPLQDDAAVALGKIGDKRALETLAGLQRSAARTAQPSIAAAICLLGINCESHEHYLVETLKFGDKNIGFQNLLRNAANGLGAIGAAGHEEAATSLFEIGIDSRDPTRAPIALALATIALRNRPVMISTLEKEPDRPAAISLMAEGFDMLEEDLAKESFFAATRHAYWDAPAGSPARELMQTLIQKLDF